MCLQQENKLLLIECCVKDYKAGAARRILRRNRHRRSICRSKPNHASADMVLVASCRAQRMVGTVEAELNPQFHKLQVEADSPQSTRAAWLWPQRQISALKQFSSPKTPPWLFCMPQGCETADCDHPSDCKSDTLRHTTRYGRTCFNSLHCVMLLPKSVECLTVAVQHPDLQTVLMSVT